MCGGCWRNPTKVSAADGRVKGGHGVEGNSNHQWGGAGGGAKSNLKTRPSRCTIVGCNTPRNAPSLSRSVPQLSFVFSSPATFFSPLPSPSLSFLFPSLSFPPFFSSSSLSSSSSSLSSSSCSSSHSIGTERDTKRDDVKSAGGTITKPFFVPPRSTLSSSIPLSPSFSLSLLVKPCQGITIHRFGGTRTRGIAVVERASVNGSIARL